MEEDRPGEEEGSLEDAGLAAAFGVEQCEVEVGRRRRGEGGPEDLVLWEVPVDHLVEVASGIQQPRRKSPVKDFFV